MHTHNKLILSAAVTAALAFSPLADAHTIAVVVACNPGGPDAISQMPAVSQGSASTATAVCPSGTYPAVAGLGGSPALLGAIGAAAAVGGGLALTSGGGSSPASNAGQPALPGSGSGAWGNPAPSGGGSSGSGNTSGLPGTPGSGDSGGASGGGAGSVSGRGNNGAPITSNEGATSPSSMHSGSQGGVRYGRGSGYAGNDSSGDNATSSGNTSGSSGQIYPVSAQPITGFPSPEISPTQLADYSATGVPLSSVGSPNSDGGQSGARGSGNSSGNTGSATNATNAGSGGGFFGHLLHSVGQAVQQIGTAVVTGGQATIPLFSGGQGQGAVAGGNNTGGLAGGGLNPNTRTTTPVTFMTGAAPGTIEIHTQPQPFTLIGGPAAYRALVRWVSGFEGSVLSVGGGGLNTVVHPGTMTPERLPSSGTSYYPYSRLKGYADFYITELGHRYVAFPGNPVRFVANIPTGGVTATIWENSQKLELSATGGFSSGPQFYTSVPGNRNGPFWPSPFTLGGPEPDIAGVCHGFKQITHVSLGGYCWSTTP